MTIKDIQNLKKIRDIKTQYNYSPTEDLEVEKSILKKINSSEESLNKRLKGLEVEDEFLLLLLMVANLEQVTRLEQERFVNIDKYTIPDYLLSIIAPKEVSKDKTPQAQRMFVEVKKCKEESHEFVITKKAYQKLRYYSQLYTLPLYFAIKFDTKIIKQWFFISGKIIEDFGKTEKRKIHNRIQECFVLDIGEIVKKDMSSLWLNNHMALLPKNSIVTKNYKKNVKNGNIYREKEGALVSHGVSNGENKLFENLVGKNLKIEKMCFSTILKHLSQGNKKVTKNKDETKIEFITKDNYFIPFYHIILNSYLELRKQFKIVNNEVDDSIGYYINNFKDFDRNLISYLKQEYYKISDKKLLLLVRMMPNLEK